MTECKNQNAQIGPHLELLEEDGCASPLHYGKQHLVSHEAHLTEGAEVPLIVPVHLFLQKTSSDLILQLQLIWITTHKLYHKMRQPGTFCRKWS